MRPPEPLGAQHQLEGFDCGNAALNRWLQQRALANERLGLSRTVVLCPDEGNDVIAYACLSAGAIVLAEVPGALRRNRPDPLPVVVLGRLAVDRRHQGQGLGRALVADALRRSLAARRLIGAVRCVSQAERLIGREQKPGWGVTYTARVRVTVTAGGRPPLIREGSGAGHGIDVDLGQAHESALKEAETDAM